MRRWVAFFLFTAVVTGMIAPVAAAISAPPPHACCIRKSAHPCHGTTLSSGGVTIGNSSCCQQPCGHAVVIPQQSCTPLAELALDKIAVSGYVSARESFPAVSGISTQQSSRAPPSC